jgi:hypothetical protein
VWFHIKAFESDFNKFITFWLWADSREKLDKLLIKKGYDKIEWIREEKPPFEN